MDNIQSEELIIGENVDIYPSAGIGGINGKGKRVVIGDSTYIGDDVQVIVDDFSIVNYCKVHTSLPLTV